MPANPFATGAAACPGVNDPEDVPEKNSMSNDHNERSGHSLLRRINGETVLNEAKRMLLARAGVIDPDAAERAMKLSLAF